MARDHIRKKACISKQKYGFNKKEESEYRPPRQQPTPARKGKKKGHASLLVGAYNRSVITTFISHQPP
jgi:hypothetical protein